MDCDTAFDVRYVSIEGGSPNNVNSLRVNDGTIVNAEGVLIPSSNRAMKRNVSPFAATSPLLDRPPRGSRVTLLVCSMISIDSWPTSRAAQARILQYWKRKRDLKSNVVFAIQREFTRVFPGMKSLMAIMIRSRHALAVAYYFIFVRIAMLFFRPQCLKAWSFKTWSESSKRRTQPSCYFLTIS